MMSESLAHTDERRRKIREEFLRRGVSIAAWARHKNFNVGLVYAVIDGRRQGVRGESAQIAMALGLREGIPGGLGEMPY